MDAITLNLFAAFALKLVNEFRHKDDVLTEEEIIVRFQTHYAEVLKKNQALLDETSPT